MRDYFRKNVAIGAAEIAGRLPMLVVLGFVARAVGPRLYGTWALVLAFQAILVSVASLGLSASLSRLASVASPERAKGYLLLALKATGTAFAAAALITLAVHRWLADLLGMSQGLTWLLFPGLLLALAGILDSTLDGYFKARENVARQCILVLVRSGADVTAIVLVFKLALVAHGAAGPTRLATYAAIAIGIRLVILPVLTLYRSGPAEAPPATERSAFLRYGIPMVPAALVVWFTGRGDALVLSHVVSRHDLGVYAFGATVAGYMTYLGYTIYPLLLPRASVLYDRDDHGQLRELFTQSQFFLLTLFAIALTAVALFAREIIQLTAGHAFREAEPVLIVLAVAEGLEVLLGSYQWVFHLVRRPSYVMWFNLVYVALQITAIVVAGHIGGIKLVPWADISVVVISNAIRYRVALRFLDIRITSHLMIGLAALLSVTAPLALVARCWGIGIRLALAVAIGLAWLAVLYARLERIREFAAPEAEPVG